MLVVFRMDGLRQLNGMIGARNEEETDKSKGRIPLIRSTEEFITTDLEKDTNYSNFVRENSSIVQSQQSLLLEHSTFPTLASTLLEQALRYCQPITTGIPKVDSLLEGGVHPGEVTEILGPIASGKSQLLHLLAINCTHLRQSTVLFIDNNSSFSPRRALLLWLRINSHTSGEEDLLREGILRNIQVIPLYDPLLLLPTLRNLLTNVEQKSSCFYSSLKLVILDNFSLLLGSILEGFTAHGLNIYSQIEKTLKYLANIHNIAIVIANRSQPLFHNTENPIDSYKYTRLGYHWNSVASTRILLDREISQHATLEKDGESKIKLYVLKSNLNHDRQQTEFRIPNTK